MQEADPKFADLELRKQFVSIAARLRARREYGYERLPLVEAAMLPLDVTRCSQSSDDPTHWQVDVAINHRELSTTYLIEEDGMGHLIFLS